MARKYVISLLKDDPESRDFCKRVTELGDRAKEQFSFLEKRRDQIVSALKTERNVIWREFEDSLRSRGMLPAGYKYDRDSIGFDETMSALSAEMRDGLGADGKPEEEGANGFPHGLINAIKNLITE